MKKLFFLFALVGLAACTKDPTPVPPNPNPIDSPVAPIDSPVVPPPKAYSYWKVGNDSFKSNNVEKAIGKLIVGISCLDRNESGNFTMVFHFGALPTSGDFPLQKSSSQNPDSAILNFYYKGNFYIPYRLGFLHRDTGVKFQARLEPTWYVNYDNPLDTVLISGIFREP